VNESLALLAVLALPAVAGVLTVTDAWPHDAPFVVQMLGAILVFDFGITIAHWLSHHWGPLQHSNADYRVGPLRRVLSPDEAIASTISSGAASATSTSASSRCCTTTCCCAPSPSTRQGSSRAGTSGSRRSRTFRPPISRSWWGRSAPTAIRSGLCSAMVSLARHRACLRSAPRAVAGSGDASLLDCHTPPSSTNGAGHSVAHVYEALGAGASGTLMMLTPAPGRR
jgi:hypothetical protein